MAGSNVLSAEQTSASMTFDVNSYTLDSRYTVTAFVKTIDPNNGLCSQWKRFCCFI